MTNKEYLQGLIDKAESLDEDLADAVYEYISNDRDTWSEMDIGDINKYFENICEKVILGSKIATNDYKAELLSKLGLKRQSLDWDKLVKDGDIIPGKALTNDQKIMLAAKYGMSPRVFGEALTEARMKWAKKEMQNIQPTINAKREYLYYLTLGDDTRQKAMKSKYAKNPELIKFFKQMDKEYSGVRGWAGALARNVGGLAAGGSVVNKYADDVLNAKGGEHENTFGGAILDYPRQFTTDVLHGAASTAVTGPALKAGQVVGKITKTPIIHPVLTNAVNGASQGLLERARQAGAGEEGDWTKAGIVAASQSTLPALLDWAAPIVKKVPILGRLLSRYRRNSLRDPIATKRQEISDQVADLNKMVQHPEVNADATRVWIKANKPEFNDALIQEGIDLKELEKSIPAVIEAYKKAQQNVHNIQRRLETSSRKIELGNFDKKTLDKIAQQKNDYVELCNARSEALARLNELKASRELLMKSQANAGQRMTDEVANEASRLQKVLDKSDDEILQYGLNTKNDIWQAQTHPSEKELYGLISSNVNAVSRQPNNLEKFVDVLGYGSNNYSRKGYAEVKHPSYQMTKEDRWEDGFVTQDELDLDEYYNWFMDRYGVAPGEPQ